jgi:hypothetical protein
VGTPFRVRGPRLCREIEVGHAPAENESATPNTRCSRRYLIPDRRSSGRACRWRGSPFTREPVGVPSRSFLRCPRVARCIWRSLFCSPPRGPGRLGDHRTRPAAQRLQSARSACPGGSARLGQALGRYQHRAAARLRHPPSRTPGRGAAYPGTGPCPGGNDANLRARLGRAPKGNLRRCHPWERANLETKDDDDDPDGCRDS